MSTQKLVSHAVDVRERAEAPEAIEARGALPHMYPVFAVQPDQSVRE